MEYKTRQPLRVQRPSPLAMATTSLCSLPNAVSGGGYRKIIPKHAIPYGPSAHVAIYGFYRGAGPILDDSQFLTPLPGM